MIDIDKLKDKKKTKAKDELKKLKNRRSAWDHIEAIRKGEIKEDPLVLALRKRTTCSGKTVKAYNHETTLERIRKEFKERVNGTK